MFYLLEVESSSSSVQMETDSTHRCVPLKSHPDHAVFKCFLDSWSLSIVHGGRNEWAARDITSSPRSASGTAVDCYAAILPLDADENIAQNSLS